MKLTFHLAFICRTMLMWYVPRRNLDCAVNESGRAAGIERRIGLPAGQQRAARTSRVKGSSCHGREWCELENCGEKCLYEPRWQGRRKPHPAFLHRSTTTLQSVKITVRKIELSGCVC